MASSLVNFEQTAVSQHSNLRVRMFYPASLYHRRILSREDNRGGLRLSHNRASLTFSAVALLAPQSANPPIHHILKQTNYKLS